VLIAHLLCVAMNYLRHPTNEVETCRRELVIWKFFLGMRAGGARRVADHDRK